MALAPVRQASRRIDGDGRRLLDAADGWLRDRFTEISVIGFEHYEDTAEELQVA